MLGKFEISKAKNGKFYFTLKASNGQVILTSQRYSSKTSCKNGIESVRTNSQLDERFEQLTGKGGSPYFVLHAGNRQVIGTSQQYKSTKTMENGIASVKKNAPEAPVVDTTI
jgi:uncharacterized protein YegP (UPF0339 family)